MNRHDFYLLRHGYRYAKREDAKWRPNPYAARNVIQCPPDTRGDFLRQLEPRIAQAVAARPGPPRMPDYPRAAWYRYWRPNAGPYANLDLSMRVAFRRARRALREYERHHLCSPQAAGVAAEVDAFRGAIERLESGNLKLQADTARRVLELRRELGLPY